MDYFAHSNPSGKNKWQSLREHLANTAMIASEIGKDTGLAEFAYIAALFHDVGKYSNEFQKRITGSGPRVDHTTAGAQEVVKLFESNPAQKVISNLLAYCISGHHSGLLDHGSVIDTDEAGTLQARLKKHVYDYQGYSQDLDLSEVVFPTRLPIQPIKGNTGFSVAFLTRMIYSILVDADFIDTETFMGQGRKPRGEYPEIDALQRRFTESMKMFDDLPGEINKRRRSTMRACIERAADNPGMFTLTVPTGGGKTFSSMAFALTHAQMHDMRRVIYIIPYTSIIEQNAAVFKDCLGSENVLEHHSNFEWGQNQGPGGAEVADDRTSDAIGKLKLASENWDIPVVTTTNVQFFESLFANRSSRCRKLHNLARSVLIFDEAQMLPREYLKPCMYAVHELVKNYGCTAVFCTATQPSIRQFLPGGSQPREITPDPQALYDFYRRVQVSYAGKVPDAELVQQINDHPQVLCIVNTRKHARGLFEAIAGEGGFHLSTLMCAAHRKKTIAEIRSRLKEMQPCRVISTQIMEAGIDVDFPVGYRAMAGLDSIIQAAGRVNREGKAKSGTLHVFDPDSEFVKRAPAYIRQGAEVARVILGRFGDPASLEAIQAYYDLLYDLQSPQAFDASRILDCFEKGAPGNYDFKTAAERFNLIEDNHMPVVIPFDDHAISLLEEVRYTQYPASFSRKLQVYIVNVYAREYETLLGRGLLDQYGGGYAVLNDMHYYHPQTGLVIPEEAGGEAIFFDG